MNSELESILNFFSLGFDPINNFIYCRTCQIILLQNAKRHVVDFHHYKMPKNFFLPLASFIELNPPIMTMYNLEKQNIDLEQLLYLKTFEGYKCLNCNYCYVKDSCYRKHNCSNNIKNVVCKSLQSFNYKNNSPYFSIYRETPIATPSAEQPHYSIAAIETILSLF